jgi:transcription elongation GreA/GreB family factor
MSRAFVRESDQPEPVPERLVSTHPNFVTPAGFEQIETRIRELEAARASEEADTSDPDEAARIARELRYWSQRRASARVIDTAPEPEVVRFGVRVTLRFEDAREQTFQLVGEDEADPARGLVSWVSPLATALIGRRAGDEVGALGSRATIVRLAS